MTLKSTDLDLEATESVAADVAQPGATTVSGPHHLRHRAQARRTARRSSLEIDRRHRPAAAALGALALPPAGLPASDFPDLTIGEFSHRFTLPAVELKRLIDNAQFAISTEETRYYLNGIYFHTADVDGTTMLRAVATDGHRLARVETPAPAGAAGMPGVIAPRKAVERSAEAARRPGAGRRDRDFAGQGALPLRRRELTTKLIDGTFPDYSRVIPTHNDKRLSSTRSRSRARSTASRRSRPSAAGRSSSSIADGRMTLSVNNPDSGSASEEIEVDYDSAPIDIGFNARYLLDIAQQLSGDTALIKLADPGSPTIILDREGAPALYVLMPLRV